jgi:hypothetical protein
VLQSWHMSNTLTIRLPRDLAAWLQETSSRTGIPQGKIVRDALESVRSAGGGPRFLRHIGAVRGGAPDLSTRKGFSRP